MDLSLLSSSEPKKKYACSKEVIKTAHDNPKELIKHYEFFIDLLKSSNKIMNWTALDALGGIVSVTGDESGLKLLISYLNKGEMITAGHAMNALKQVALAKPEFRVRVINELIKVPKYKYDSPECNRVACGRVIAILEHLGANGKSVISFLKKQSKSKRAAVKKRAIRLLSKIY